MSPLEHICEVLSEIEFADDTAEKLSGAISAFRQYRRVSSDLARVLVAIEEACEHSVRENNW